MSLRDRAVIRAMFLSGTPESERPQWAEGKRPFAAWIRARCEALTEDQLMNGRRPGVPIIRDILREEMLGAISIGHINAVFQTVSGFWLLDNDAEIEAAARLVNPKMILIEAEAPKRRKRGAKHDEAA